jgi:predicted transcriptional regulator
MSHISKITFEDWQKEQLKDPEFVAAMRELEPGYQIARLRIQRGLTQAQLAEMVGTKQPAIARIESGKSLPSLSFLKRIAEVLGAYVEIRVVPQ